MAQLRCADGRELGLVPVPVLDRADQPYEVTLRLLLDGQDFGHVGERCGFLLAGLAARLRDAGPDVVPPSLTETAVRAAAREAGEDGTGAWERVRRHLPHDHELLCLRSRDPDDPSGTAELRATARRAMRWAGGAWHPEVTVVLEAWGADGTGVRAVLTLDGLRTLLDALLRECAGQGAAYDVDALARGTA